MVNFSFLGDGFGTQDRCIPSKRLLTRRVGKKITPTREGDVLRSHNEVLNPWITVFFRIGNIWWAVCLRLWRDKHAEMKSPECDVPFSSLFHCSPRSSPVFIAVPAYISFLRPIRNTRAGDVRCKECTSKKQNQNDIICAVREWEWRYVRIGFKSQTLGGPGRRPLGRWRGSPPHSACRAHTPSSQQNPRSCCWGKLSLKKLRSETDLC